MQARVLAAIVALGAFPLAASGAFANTVSYEQVLAEPDNVELNLRFAEARSAEGNHEQAASTLERLLLLRPDWDQARLFYALTLYRLGDFEGAERELDLLRSRSSLSATEQATVNRLYDLSKARSKRTRVLASIAVGASVDSDPGFSVFNDQRFGSSPDVDGAANLLGNIRLEHELATGRGDFLFAELSGSALRRFDQVPINFDDAQLKFGGTFYLGDFSITPFALGTASLLRSDYYRGQAGGGMELRFALREDIDLYASGGLLWQDFNDVPIDTRANERDGLYGSVKFGTEMRLFPWWTADLSASYTNKNAENSLYDWVGYGANLTQQFGLSRGQYIRASLDYRYRDFEGSTASVGDDQRFISRLAYGVPLQTLFSAFGTGFPSLDLDLQVGAAYSYFNQSGRGSSENYSADIYLIKRFAF